MRIYAGILVAVMTIVSGHSYGQEIGGTMDHQITGEFFANFGNSNGFESFSSISSSIVAESSIVGAVADGPDDFGTGVFGTSAVRSITNSLIGPNWVGSHQFLGAGTANLNGTFGAGSP